jgi:hypothetical protein
MNYITVRKLQQLVPETSLHPGKACYRITRNWCKPLFYRGECGKYVGEGCEGCGEALRKHLGRAAQGSDPDAFLTYILRDEVAKMAEREPAPVTSSGKNPFLEAISEIT